eukprot:1150235-Pelagomonas_calceolata.AAC.4
MNSPPFSDSRGCFLLPLQGDAARPNPAASQMGPFYILMLLACFRPGRMWPKPAQASCWA